MKILTKKTDGKYQIRTNIIIGSNCIEKAAHFECQV
jgi:hypothetical protein